MARKGDRKPKTITGDFSDPRGLAALARTFLDSLEVRNYSPETIAKRRLHLKHFIAWCLERSLHQPIEITRPILERYQRHLFHSRDKSGQPLSFNNQHQRLSSLRCWFKGCGVCYKKSGFPNPPIR